MTLPNIEHLPQDVQNILASQVALMVEEYQPLGILLVGSYVNGIPNKHSDIDIYIIAQDQDWRERGNYLVNGYEIEYFINPVKQIRAYFEKENGIQKHTAHMFSTGILLYQQSEVVGELITKAEKYLNDIEPMEGTEKELALYSLDDAEKDLLNALEDDNMVAYHVTAVRIFERVLNLFFRHHQTIMPKSMMLEGELRKIDNNFANLVIDTINNDYTIDQLKPLISYMEQLLGGKRATDWVLHSKLDLN